MQKVYEHYQERLDVHRTMLKFHKERKKREFVELALAIKNPAANYSAYEHGLGARILANVSAVDSVFALGTDFWNCQSPKHIPNLIIERSIPYLKISVGSEIAMLIKPNDFWVANVRTVWAYLIVKHAYNIKLANEELQLYRDNERTSEMDYGVWTELHRLLETSQTHLHDLGVRKAQKENIPIGDLKYLWADAIANALFESKTPK